MVTFLNFNFLLFFILFFPLSYFFSSKYTFLSSPSAFFFSSLFFSSTHVLLLSHPPSTTPFNFQPFLIFYCFILLLLFLLISFSILQLCSLYFSVQDTSFSSAQPIVFFPTVLLFLFISLVHGFFFFFFFFGFEGKNCRRNHFGRGFCRCLLLLLFFSFFFFLVVVGLMSVGVVGFVINVVVVVGGVAVGWRW